MCFRFWTGGAFEYRSRTRSGGGIFPLVDPAKCEVCFFWHGCRTKEKALRPKPEGFTASPSEGRVAGFDSGVAVRSCCWGFRLSAAEPAHGVGTHAPEDRELRGLGLLRLAVLALVLRADELSVHEDMVALVDRVGNGLAEAVESHDAMPLGFGLPFVVRVLPRLLGSDGQHGEIRAVAADLPLLRVFPEEAD
jgi:hypothetical protein